MLRTSDDISHRGGDSRRGFNREKVQGHHVFIRGAVQQYNVVRGKSI
jgi:hypothetical protein